MCRALVQQAQNGPTTGSRSPVSQPVGATGAALMWRRITSTYISSAIRVRTVTPPPLGRWHSVTRCRGNSESHPWVTPRNPHTKEARGPDTPPIFTVSR
jgi:hypothetical protein